MSEYEPARDGSDHLLTCGPCNGFPEFGPCTRDDVCNACGEPCKRGGGCRSCALERWQTA